MTKSDITQKRVERTKAFKIIFPFLFFTSVTLADIYKCHDTDGSVHFSDNPCNEKSEPIELEPLNISSGTKSVSSDEGELEFGERVDLLVCPGGEGTKLPIKLCLNSSSLGCVFNNKYLKRVVSNIDDLKADVSQKQLTLLNEQYVSKTELWEFGTPGNEWDVGTGIRGYVVLNNVKAEFFVAAIYQGFPNKPPSGQARLLPLDSTKHKKCSARTILDRI